MASLITHGQTRHPLMLPWEQEASDQTNSSHGADVPARLVQTVAPWSMPMNREPSSPTTGHPSSTLPTLPSKRAEREAERTAPAQSLFPTATASSYASKEHDAVHPPQQQRWGVPRLSRAPHGATIFPLPLLPRRTYPTAPSLRRPSLLSPPLPTPS